MVSGMSAPASPRNSRDDEELEYLSSATLTKRKDFLEAEEEARTAPNRVLYYRRNADCERLIKACTAKLAAEPSNVRALLIRAASYTKKGGFAAPPCACDLPGHKSTARNLLSCTKSLHPPSQSWPSRCVAAWRRLSTPVDVLSL